ncbi:hypothetical protein TNCV_279541 [Trichonephila clavipes]|nr:hypothetical protein TNCV_279541 [Trichonephila clavipes]
MTFLPFSCLRVQERQLGPGPGPRFVLGIVLISASSSSCASASSSNARELDEQILEVKINPQEKNTVLDTSTNKNTLSKEKESENENEETKLIRNDFAHYVGTPIDAYLREQIFKLGPYPPEGNFQKDAKGRSFSSSYYSFISKAGQKIGRKWLCYSTRLHVLTVRYVGSSLIEQICILKKPGVKSNIPVNILRKTVNFKLHVNWQNRYRSLSWHYFPRWRPISVTYSQFGLAIHQNDHQARRRFVEWAQNEIVVVPDFHKRILFSDEAHFWLNGYVNKQNCRIWREANPQVYVETPLHPEKLTVWCALWAGGILLQKR